MPFFNIDRHVRVTLFSFCGHTHSTFHFGAVGAFRIWRAHRCRLVAETGMAVGTDRDWFEMTLFGWSWSMWTLHAGTANFTPATVVFSTVPLYAELGSTYGANAGERLGSPFGT